MNEENSKYRDIIHMPYNKSKRRKQMDIKERAAQFAPFAALTGHSEAIDETARVTDKKIDLDECIKAEINRKLLYARENPHVIIEVTYFVKDEYKDGGEYVKIKGNLEKTNEYKNTITVNSIDIPVNNIFDVLLDSI